MLPFSHYRDPKLGLASMLAQHPQKGDAQSEKLFQGLADSIHCLGLQPGSRGWLPRCWAEKAELVWHSTYQCSWRLQSLSWLEAKDTTKCLNSNEAH